MKVRNCLSRYWVLMVLVAVAALPTKGARCPTGKAIGRSRLSAVYCKEHSTIQGRICGFTQAILLLKACNESQVLHETA